MNQKPEALALDFYDSCRDFGDRGEAPFLLDDAGGLSEKIPSLSRSVAFGILIVLKKTHASFYDVICEAVRIVFLENHIAGMIREHIALVLGD